MAFLALVELLTLIFGFYVLTTQIVVPLFRGTALFPFFHRARQRNDLVALHEDAEVAELEKEVKRLVEELKRQYGQPETKENTDVSNTGKS